jgi:tetratricopeptide (TPR) repeat protein
MRCSSLAARPPAWTALFLWAFIGVISLMLGGCAVQTQALREHPPADLPHEAELADTPFFAQTEYQCGPAALATALSAIGVAADPAVLGQEVFLPARTGTLQVEMIAGARRRGVLATRMPQDLQAVLREVHAGHPVVVLQNLGLSWAPLWHYAVLVGYDIDVGDVFLRSGQTRRQALPMRTFEHTWKRSGFWAFVVTPPGQWPAQADEKSAVEAAVGFERNATPSQAVMVYRSALARWPANLSLRMGLGNSLYGAGDKRGAADAFREAATAHRSAPAWINLSATLLELGDKASAIDAAQQAITLADDVWQGQAREALNAAQAAR